MKNLFPLIILIIFSINSNAQCEMFYQKSNGDFAFNESCALLIKKRNGYTSKQMKKLIEKELKNVRKLSKRQVKEYGEKKMAEAEAYRRKKEKENRIRLIVENRQNQSRRNRNSTPTVKHKKKRTYKAKKYAKTKPCHSNAWHRKNGSCASEQ